MKLNYQFLNFWISFQVNICMNYAGLLELGQGVPWHQQILTDQLNLPKPSGIDYAIPHFYWPLRFLEPHTALMYLARWQKTKSKWEYFPKRLFIKMMKFFFILDSTEFGSDLEQNILSPYIYYVSIILNFFWHTHSLSP